MSTTNDEQGKYGEQPKREPVLSDERLKAIAKLYPEVNGDTGTAHDANFCPGCGAKIVE